MHVLAFGQWAGGFYVLTDESEMTARIKLGAAFKLGDVYMDVDGGMASYGMPVTHVDFELRG